ncbi:nuclear autoantigenic sperm protein-like [Scomber japonicus]|uniref:nuclear autoantigenic sperm protein-like n=1 Tax=Scomber japonicus TaxID=13676 RepID=UPI0023067D92|nr:nuclear autoantigenic sperm protein-like [Scomber japonicus]XP_053185980.1 nuclear autoantigenic sperm protein-like [Scomber japonicus]
MEEANKLIGAGKKHLVMGKAVEAVSALQEACGMLAKKYGDTADECGEALFWCGKALLELARMENSVLGNALEGVPEGEDEEKPPKDSNVESTESVDEKTRDELRVQVYDAMAEKKNEDAENKGDAEKTEAGDEQKTKKEDGDESKSDENKENKEAEKEEQAADKPEEEAEDGEEDGEEEEDDAEVEGEAEGQGEGDDAAEKDSDDEEVDNLQLAWEMLEVAKVIYKRKEAKEDQLMAAQTHLKLGEVSAESGNYTQALEDFQECLKLQLKHLDSDSRLLAETHYQLGLTYSMNQQYSQAIEELNSSISVINSRLEKLQGLMDKAEGPEALPDERKEMEELKALLPEIKEKVEDATEGLKTAGTDTEAMKGVLDGGSTSSAFPTPTVQSVSTSSSSKTNGTSTNEVSSTNAPAPKAPVSDISHLVRKKRKPEESPVKEGAVKKVKQDDAKTNGADQPHTNGVHKANGDTNGHANGMEVESK